MSGVKNYLDYEVAELEKKRVRLKSLLDFYDAGSLAYIRIEGAIAGIGDAIIDLESLPESETVIPPALVPASRPGSGRKIDQERKLVFTWLHDGGKGFTFTEIGRMFNIQRQTVRFTIKEGGESRLPGGGE